MSKYLKENRDVISFTVPKGNRVRYRAVAAAEGLSFRQFCLQALDEKIAQDSE